MWHTTCCTWSALHVLHVICTWLHTGHLKVHAVDSLQRSEEIVKNSQNAPFNAIVIIITIIITITNLPNHQPQFYYWQRSTCILIQGCLHHWYKSLNTEGQGNPLNHWADLSTYYRKRMWKVHQQENTENSTTQKLKEIMTTYCQNKWVKSVSLQWERTALKPVFLGF